MKKTFLAGITLCFLLGGTGCATRKGQFSTGKIPGTWNLGQIRAATVDTLSFYGPVKNASRNRFQSSRIPSNELSNLGREFTLVTVKVDANHPHRVYVSSAVYVRQKKKGFAKKGKNKRLERQVLIDIRKKLDEVDY